MLIAATLSLALAYAARRIGVRPEQIRELSRDPRWISTALLAAVLLGFAVHQLLRSLF